MKYSKAKGEAVRLIYRYTDLDWEQALRKVDQKGPTDAVCKYDDSHRLLDKAKRDDFELDEFGDGT